VHRVQLISMQHQQQSVPLPVVFARTMHIALDRAKLARRRLTKTRPLCAARRVVTAMLQSIALETVHLALLIKRLAPLAL